MGLVGGVSTLGASLACLLACLLARGMGAEAPWPEGLPPQRRAPVCLTSLSFFARDRDRGCPLPSLLRQGMGGGLSPPATRAPHVLWGFEEA